MYEITLNGDTILSISKIKSSGETGFIYITDKDRGYFDNYQCIKYQKKRPTLRLGYK